MDGTHPQSQAVVFDLGGTHLRCGVWEGDGTVSGLRRTSVANFLGHNSSESVWQNLLTQMSDYCLRVASRTSPGAPVIISFPGPIRLGRQVLSAPTLLGCVQDIPDLVGDLEELTGRRVHILNDLSAAAWYLSASVPVDRFMVITVSSGIGSKIFDRGSSSGVIDFPAWAGEIGHMVVDRAPNAPRCDCGGMGHLGAIASGRGVERIARQRALEDPTGFAGSACAGRFEATSVTLNNENHVVPAALIGDMWCLDVIREATRPLARLVLSVVVAAGIQRVIIIGGFALSLGPVYLQILRDELLAAHDYDVLTGEIESLVEMGAGCEEACLMGAGAFAERILGVRQ